MRSRSTLRARSLYNDRINRNLSDGLLNDSSFSRFVRVSLVQGRCYAQLYMCSRLHSFHCRARPEASSIIWSFIVREMRIIETRQG